MTAAMLRDLVDCLIGNAINFAALWLLVALLRIRHQLNLTTGDRTGADSSAITVRSSQSLNLQVGSAH